MRADGMAVIALCVHESTGLEVGRGVLVSGRQIAARQAACAVAAQLCIDVASLSTRKGQIAASNKHAYTQLLDM